VGTANRTGLLIYTGIFSSRGSNILADTSLLGEVARHSRLNKFHNFVAVSRRELFVIPLYWEKWLDIQDLTNFTILSRCHAASSSQNSHHCRLPLG